MSNRSTGSTRLRSSPCPIELHRRLSAALGGTPRTTPSGLMEIDFPNVDSSTFREEYLLKEILRKYPGFDLGGDPSATALEAFMAQEVVNRETNRRLQSLPFGEDPRVLEAFSLAGRKVREVLGTFDWNLFADGLRFGPGATTRLGAKASNLVNKLTGVPHVTSRLKPLAYQVLQMCPFWAYEINPCVSEDTSLVVCEHDIVTTVPKNAKTDRTIAKQPDMNVFIQLAIAFVMRKKLQRWGINLNDQSINQARARQGSIDGRLATVDLKNASSSMCSELVWRLVGDFPHAHSAFDRTWYDLLDISRTEFYRLPTGQIQRYELFSQMGNGYTFELESLLFWALAHSVCVVQGVHPDVSVYGDDLIVPVETVSFLKRVLRYTGLMINEDKTFFSNEGNIFRESCGKHYLNGRDVTPIYVKDDLDSVETLVLLCNNIKRWALLPGYGLDGRLKEVYDWVKSFLPRDVQKTCIPFGDEDDGLIKDFDEATPSLAYSKGIGKIVDSNFLIVPVRLPPQREGYRCNTAKVYTRGKLPRGREGLLVWLYGKSYKTHKEQALNIIDRLDQMFNVYEPYKVPSLKKELKYGTRVVTHWRNTGPWIMNIPDYEQWNDLEGILGRSLSRLEFVLRHPDIPPSKY